MNIFKTIFKNRERKLVSEVVVLSVIFGFAAGMVGQIFADVYINPWGDTGAIQATNTNQDLSRIPELKKVKKFLGIQQDFEVSKSVEQNAASVVGIYLKKAASKDYLNDIYLSQDLKGNAFILTTDGWMVTHQSVVGNFKKEQLVVFYGGKVLAIDKLVVDSATGVAFIKVVSDNLPVVVLGDSDEIDYGQLVLMLDAVDEVVVANIKSFNRNEVDLAKNLIYSSEVYNDYLVLQDEVGRYFLGSPLINLGGEVIGVVSSIDQNNKLIKIVPINQFKNIISGVLRSGAVKRVYLGVNYLDLSTVVGLSDNLTHGLNQGALVVGSILKNSPAGQADIKINDIILNVQGEQVDGNKKLTSIIQQYNPGDKVNIEIMRGKEKIVKKITLAATN